MKNILLSIVFGALLFAVAGCYKYQEATPETLEVSTKTLDAPAEGKTFVVKIQSGSGNWKAMSEPLGLVHLTITPSSRLWQSLITCLWDVKLSSRS